MEQRRRRMRSREAHEHHGDRGGELEIGAPDRRLDQLLCVSTGGRSQHLRHRVDEQRDGHGRRPGGDQGSGRDQRPLLTGPGGPQVGYEGNGMAGGLFELDRWAWGDSRTLFDMVWKLYMLLLDGGLLDPLLRPHDQGVLGGHLPGDRRGQGKEKEKARKRKRNRKGAGPKEHKRCMNLPTPCARDSPLFRSLSSLSCAGVQKVLEPVAGDGPGRLEL